jgi:hypothetical protein
MPPLPPNLSRLGDDLQAAAERAIQARKARNAAIRRGIIVVLVAVTPAVLVMPEGLAPFRPPSIAALTPAGDIVTEDPGADEADVAAGIRFATYRRRLGSRQASAIARTSRPASMWNRPLGEPRARL